MRVASIGTNCAPKINYVKKKNNFSFISLMPAADKVSFSGRYKTTPVNVSVDNAEFVANSLSTSTSGHRATYGSEIFNKEVVQLMTLGVAKYAKDVAKQSGKEPVVLIGGDTRQATKESLEFVKDTLTGQGINVLYIDKPVPTPLHALATQKENIDVSILLTASHNPWSDGGYNLVTKEGAIAPPSVTKKVAENMVQIAKVGNFTVDTEQKGKITKLFPYDMYKDTINSYNLIDWENIKNANISINYDSLQGTGENVFPRLLNDYSIKLNDVHSGLKEGPNPTGANLSEVKEAIQNDKNNLKIGLANDGDADRFGVIDENGTFIEPNDIILLTAYHLAKNKGLTGSIIRSQATSSQLDIYAKNNGLNVIQTPVGFKYIGEDIIDLRKEGEDILVAGEESGGLTINGHIPEKDGIIALLLMLDLVATEKKPISQILEDIKTNLNTEFRADSFSKKLDKESDKEIIMDRMKSIYNEGISGNNQFGSDFEIDIKKTEENQKAMERYKKGGDGVKLYLTDESSILVRKSGTEPKVKAYIEVTNDDAKNADVTLKMLRKELENLFTI